MLNVIPYRYHVGQNVQVDGVAGIIIGQYSDVNKVRHYSIRMTDGEIHDIREEDVNERQSNH